MISIAGNGAFLMSSMELSTLIENNLDIKVLVFNDSSYNSIKLTRLEKYGGRFIASDLNEVNFVELAKSFGVKGVRIESNDDLNSSLVDSLRGESPTVIDALIDSRLKPPIPPPFTKIPKEL